MPNLSLSVDRSYDGVAKTLHWLIVVLLIAQYTLGWAMPEVHRGAEPVGLILWHLEIGAIVIAVALVRLVWRVLRPVPLVTINVPAWQLIAARMTHILLYVLLVALPIVGWINASGRNWTPTLFGVFPLPLIPGARSPIGHAVGETHIVMSYVLLGVITLHIVAALYHHFLLRDETLKRMLPQRG